ncbi:hypothetical protein D3C78_1098800 [compost metagenome]
MLGDFGRAGEYQGVDVVVQGQGLADGVTVTRQHVQHAFRDAGFDSQFSDADGGQRGFFGRLEDHRVTGGQRRTEFPARHHQREVPRHDGAHHTHRLTGHKAQLIVRSGCHFVVDLVDGFAAPAQGLRRAGNVDVQGIADRLAHVQGFKQGQLFGVLFEQAGKTDHGGLAFGRRQTRPDTGIERGASVFHGALGIGGVTTGNLAEQTAIDRADALECLAGNGVGVFAIDIGAAFDFQVAGTLFPVGTGQGGHASVLLLLIRHPRSSRALSGILPGQPAFRPKASTTLNQPHMKFQYI